MIQTLINWAEIIGGLAIVISLIFVAIQIRSSVIQSRADSYTKVSELWLNFTSVIASNEETWRIFHTREPATTKRLLQKKKQGSGF